MLRKMRAMLPHGAILIANMFIVFFLIDRVNTAMNFIDNRLTKGLLLAMCALVLCDLLLPGPKRRKALRAEQTPAAAPATPTSTAHRPRHAAKGKEADT